MKILLHVCAVLIAVRLGQAQNYIAEVSFFVADEVVRRYQRELSSTRAEAEAEFRKDFDYTITETNILLQTLRGISFQVAVRSVNILTENIFNSGFLTPSRIDNLAALQTAKEWLIEEGYYATLKYDAAVIYTGYDIVASGSIYSEGTAYRGSGCDNTTSLAVVEFNATYATAISTAKKIAAIFGTAEDGVAQKYAGSRYNYPRDKDRWSFNPCAAEAIQAYLDTLSTNCLQTTSSESTTPNVSPASYTGRLFDPDVICQRTLNDDRSYMAKFGDFFDDQQPGGDNICQIFFCWRPGSTFYDDAYPSEGMVCADNQRCNNGVCGSGVSSTDNCVLGDQKELFFPSLDFQGTCTEYIAMRPYRCYSTHIGAACCDTCARTRAPGSCPWGDKYPDWCRKYTREQVCPGYGDDVDCCEYCSGFRRKRFADAPLIEPINVTIDYFEETSYHIAKERVVEIQD